MGATLDDTRVSALDIAGQVRAGTRSAREIALEHLERAHAVAHLGALWHLDDAEVLRAAELVDARRRGGRELGPLAGVPVVVKDSFAVKGMPRSGGVGEPRVDADDASAVARLRRAGAVVLGKAAMHQLAWGTTGQCPGHPPVLNPVSPGRQPGGSSSGSAVAVAAGVAPVALGSDTAGSVRVPAAWCGVVGFRPRQESVSRAGVLPLAPSFDAVGWLTRDVADAAALAGVLYARRPPSRGGASAPLRAIADPGALDSAEPEVRAAVVAAIDGLRADGVEVTMGDPGLPKPRVRTLFAAEFAAAWPALDPDDPRLGEDVREGLRAGAAVRAVDYLGAHAEREAAREAAALDADVLLLPAVPAGPPPLDAPDDIRMTTRFTRPFSALDWASLVVPVGHAAAAAIQVSAPRGGEAAIWAVGKALARET
jgi:Asp-tRNA(Asn)/Glu-tRNA(Gln) amidotransferase A subunit family amidase